MTRSIALLTMTLAVTACNKSGSIHDGYRFEPAEIDVPTTVALDLNLDLSDAGIDSDFSFEGKIVSLAAAVNCQVPKDQITDEIYEFHGISRQAAAPYYYLPSMPLKFVLGDGSAVDSMTVTISGGKISTEATLRMPEVIAAAGEQCKIFYSLSEDQSGGSLVQDAGPALIPPYRLFPLANRDQADFHIVTHGSIMLGLAYNSFDPDANYTNRLLESTTLKSAMFSWDLIKAHINAGFSEKLNNASLLNAVAFLYRYGGTPLKDGQALLDRAAPDCCGDKVSFMTNGFSWSQWSVYEARITPASSLYLKDWDSTITDNILGGCEQFYKSGMAFVDLLRAASARGTDATAKASLAFAADFVSGLLYRTDITSDFVLADKDNSEKIAGQFYLNSDVTKELSLFDEVSVYVGTGKVGDPKTSLGRARKSDLVDGDASKIFALTIPEGTAVPEGADRFWIYPVYVSHFDEGDVMLPFYVRMHQDVDPGVLSADKTTLTFEETDADETLDKTLTLTNSDGRTLVLGSLEDDDLGLAAPFSNAGTGTCEKDGKLGPGASCTIVVTFAPTAAGTFTDSLAVPYNNGEEDTSLTVSLSATGNVPSVSISPKSADLGQGTTGAPLTLRQFTITNKSGSTITLGNFTTSGELGLADPFYYQNGDTSLCYGGKILAHKAFCTIKVGAVSASVGTFTDSLVMPYTIGIESGSVSAPVTAKFVAP